MGSLGGWEYLFGPAMSFVVVGVLVVLLRWAFGRNRSLVERRSARGTPQEYGLLVRVAAPPTFVEAEMIRLHLVEGGLRATLAPTTEGPAVMVFHEDEPAARRLLDRSA